MELDQRRDLIDMQSVYQEYRRVFSELRTYRGGMTWKQAKGHEYLFKIRNRQGAGKSLGRRSPETERIFDNFHRRKKNLMERKKELESEIGKRSRVLRARGMGRIPKIGADVLRVLDQEGLLDNELTVLGTYALYAYEALAGIYFKTELLATGDVDILYDARQQLRLRADVEGAGMIGVLKKVDRSFQVSAAGHFRAINNKGFMVEFITQAPDNVLVTPVSKFSSASEDVVPAEMPDVRFLLNAPSEKVTALDAEGKPVFMRVPEPRYFALNKLWMSSKSDRERLKARRDSAQACAVATLCVHHLNLPFDERVLQAFPQDVRERFKGLANEIAAEVDEPQGEDDLGPSF